MSRTETAVRAALAEEYRQLEAQCARLKKLSTELPDCDGTERGRLQTAASLRGVIECVLADRLAPAAAALRQAARIRTGRGRSPGKGAPAAASPVRLLEARV